MVTGGCGFIGSHIVDKLIDENYQVGVVDNLLTGKLEHLSPIVTFYKCDIVDRNFLKVVEDFQPEFIIHQAAQVSVPVSINNILLDADINIKGTSQVIDAARRNKVKKIVFASSAAVYGDPQYLPIDENHPINPKSPYGLSKYTAELYLQLARNLYGIDYTILRYSNVYGPRQDSQGEGGVVSIFINKLIRGECPTIFGDGEQTRDFVYVEDVAMANVNALKFGENGIFNISSGTQTSVNQLYSMLIESLSILKKPFYTESRLGDIKHSVLDNICALKNLSLQNTPLNKGLEKTISYFKPILLSNLSER